MLLLGGVKSRRIQWLSFAWFFGSAFIIAVMLYGKRTYGWP
ncbi:hypothetical protein [Myxococcus guangdongensis]|nr:hypothetical protein [Myxococcus guangdongensis]